MPMLIGLVPYTICKCFNFSFILVVATPAPNMYRVVSAQTNCGIQKGPNPTLKGRPSPFVYSGFRKMLAG